jgi:hypothetical protein
VKEEQMLRSRRRIVGWVALAAAVASVTGVAFFLLGATSTGDEVLSIEAAVRLDYGLAYDDGGHEWEGADRRRIQLFLAVTSPSRGAVDQLRTGNIRIYDAYHFPYPGPEYGDPFDHSQFYAAHQAEAHAKPGDFENMGGGFYRVDLLTESDWEPVHAVLQIEIVCPWGRGITVCEVPLGMVWLLKQCAQDFPW